MADRRYTEQEVAEILRTAVEIQSADQSQFEKSQGFSLADIERIAGEVGIDGRHVSLAALTFGRENVQNKKSTFWGCPVRQTFEYSLDGELSHQGWEEVVADLRDRYGYNGTPSQVGTSLEFRTGNDFRALHFAITPRNGQSRVRVALRLFEVVALTWIMSFLVTFLFSVAFIAGMAKAGHFAFGLAIAMCVASCTFFLANRIATGINRRERKAVQDSISSIAHHMAASMPSTSTVPEGELQVLRESKSK